jgi:hypothetical protein
LVGAAMLGAVAARRDITLQSRSHLDPSRLPGTLDPFSLTLGFA